MIILSVILEIAVYFRLLKTRLNKKYPESFPIGNGIKENHSSITENDFVFRYLKKSFS